MNLESLSSPKPSDHPLTKSKFMALLGIIQLPLKISTISKVSICGRTLKEFFFMENKSLKLISIFLLLAKFRQYIFWIAKLSKSNTMTFNLEKSLINILNQERSLCIMLTFSKVKKPDLNIYNLMNMFLPSLVSVESSVLDFTWINKKPSLLIFSLLNTSVMLNTCLKNNKFKRKCKKDFICMFMHFKENLFIASIFMVETKLQQSN